MKEYENKVVIVVGSTSGIGKAMAEKFAENGATVIITGRRTEKGKEVAAQLTKKGYHADFAQMDVMDISSAEKAIDAIVAKHGRLDAFLYNAGIAGYGELDSQVWDNIMTTNAKAAYFLGRKAFSYLKETKGALLFTSSMSGIKASCNISQNAGIAYGMSKAAVNHMVSMLALQYATSGVRVNGIAPGLTKTDILNGVSDELLHALEQEIPLHFAAEPSDMANVAYFLCSESSRFITGEVINVNGGAAIN